MMGFLSILAVALVIIFSYNAQTLPPYLIPECVPFWRYRGDRGQDHWCCKGSHLCCGEYQSPINIDIRHSTYDKKGRCLKLHYYNCMPKATAIHNNGQTVELIYTAYNYSSVPYVSGGPMTRGSRFYLDRAIFHWGSNSSQGSEHTLDYNQLPLEMQLIHRNWKYQTIAEARNKTDGLLFMSVLFMLNHEDNDNLRGLIYNLHQVRFLGQTKCIKPFPIEMLMPQPYGYYYTYNGSIPFPPCKEVVLWVIFHNPVPISEHQLNEFRKLQDLPEANCPKHNCPLVDNWRKTVCVKNRVIYWKEECVKCKGKC